MKMNENIYAEALAWANNLGNSGGATRMRQFLMSLYNTDFYAYSVGEASTSMDAQGRTLLLGCIEHYMKSGETEGLRRVGDSIFKSGSLDEFIELCEVSYQARVDLKALWREKHERKTDL
jgi:hypothetical protein